MQTSQSFLRSELIKFYNLNRQLNSLLKETQKYFEVVDDASNSAIQLLERELEKWSCMEQKARAPIFLILGQCCYSRARLLNIFLQLQLLPTERKLFTADGHCKIPWQDIHISHGNQNGLRVVLPNNFEFLEPVNASGSTFVDTVSLQQLERSHSENVSDNACDNVGNNVNDNHYGSEGIEAVQIYLRHDLLKTCVEILVAQSAANVGDLSQFLPICFYVISESRLTQQELVELEVLRSLIGSDTPILFVFDSKVHEISSETLYDQRNVRPSVDGELNQPIVSTLTSQSVQCNNCGNMNRCTERHSQGGNVSNTLSNSNDSVTSGCCTHGNYSGNFGGENLVGLIKNGAESLGTEDEAGGYFEQLLDAGFLSISSSMPTSVPSSSSMSNSIPNPPSSSTSLQPEMYSDSYNEVSKVESELLEDFSLFIETSSTFTRNVLHRYLLRLVTELNVFHLSCTNRFISAAFEMLRDVQVTPRRLDFVKEKETQLFGSLLNTVVAENEIKKLIEETLTDWHESFLKLVENFEFIGISIPADSVVRSSRDLRICTGQIQDFIVKTLNKTIADKLVGSMDVLHANYTGVLQRCLDSLENKQPSDVQSRDTSAALGKILNAAYQIEVTFKGRSSLVKVLVERMKQVVRSMNWKTLPKVDKQWKRLVAANMLDSLSPEKLARTISGQLRRSLENSHRTFESHLQRLECLHSGRLERTENDHYNLCKVHAPRAAKLTLKSTCLKDTVLFGMPVLEREIGRGQYGVVYGCSQWGGHSPCAVKSVVPPDEKHWNDLALEFFYTKNLPDHDRVVALRGSVIDVSFGSGKAVLLIMDRYEWDFYTAIENGLNFAGRLQIAIDVVEGIRFLHSQGLVHRDIKLKNVLLDRDARGKITDLGFCKPEAMMSGTIVGTPIHMAPELFSGKYDNTVDVYAFGILFWYVCAGNVSIPNNYERCCNKEVLWRSVKDGIRPERLDCFDDECWRLMSQCWESDPIQRPYLGDVEPRLQKILGLEIHR